ncbi:MULTISPECIES: DUF1149 family protein [unclassified Streptococcus]|uniref:DUF1149 family protein n=1 Tax=unclassified Streptococcus TaxID=2608887 RepID=UPI0018AC5BFB|nr:MULTISPECIES: DUF1149 family protein [unclassified Streptococcus]MBF8969733.1 DUF1149 family protein [Streptococcus sp. NLN76]MBG9366652.1 DUF1149 family protein [Streptococcus sp. NLN64]MBJ6744854.1 DUF1149 family protein [Streptococcus sp. 121]
MELVRDKIFVSQYHYDARNFEWEKENGAPETKIDVNFQLISRDEASQKTSMVVIVSFMVVFDTFVISGVISQTNHVQDRFINEPNELEHAEVQQLAEPSLGMLNRLTYEVTEIALDMPGINLEF